MNLARRTALIVGMPMLALVFTGGGRIAAARQPLSDNAETVIVLVRHAEKQSGGRDPGLTEVGEERTKRLARMLSSMKITAVYSTPYKRTQMTASPVASTIGKDTVVYDPRKLADLAKKLASEGGRALVVGHSNTTTELVKLLGGEVESPIRDEDEFDRLYIVTLLGDHVSTMLLRY